MYMIEGLLSNITVFWYVKTKNSIKVLSYLCGFASSREKKPFILNII